MSLVPVNITQSERKYNEEQQIIRAGEELISN
jgi:hypothetical protein